MRAECRRRSGFASSFRAGAGWRGTLRDRLTGRTPRSERGDRGSIPCPGTAWASSSIAESACLTNRKLLVRVQPCPPVPQVSRPYERDVRFSSPGSRTRRGSPRRCPVRRSPTCGSSSTRSSRSPWWGGLPSSARGQGRGRFARHTSGARISGSLVRCQRVQRARPGHRAPCTRRAGPYGYWALAALSEGRTERRDQDRQRHSPIWRSTSRSEPKNALASIDLGRAATFDCVEPPGSLRTRPPVRPPSVRTHGRRPQEWL